MPGSSPKCQPTWNISPSHLRKYNGPLFASTFSGTYQVEGLQNPKSYKGMFGYVHNPGYIHLVPEKVGERRLRSTAHVYFAKVEIKHPLFESPSKPRKVNTKAKDYGTMETDIFQPYLF